MTSTSRLERSRYVLLRYTFERALQEDELRRIFTSQLNRLFGIKGSLEMGLFLSWVHPKEPLIIIRTSHTSVMDLYCVSFFISSFENKSISIIPLKTAGSIKTLQELATTANWKDFKEIMS